MQPMRLTLHFRVVQGRQGVVINQLEGCNAASVFGVSSYGCTRARCGNQVAGGAPGQLCMVASNTHEKRSKGGSTGGWQQRGAAP